MSRYDGPEEIVSRTDERLLQILDMVGDALGIDMDMLPDIDEAPDPELTLDDLLGALIDDLSQQRKALNGG